MKSKEDFEFLNSDVWLKYTHQRYVPLEDIRHRLKSIGLKETDWPSIKVKILKFRKMACIPLFLETLKIKFWMFPADCISEKLQRIESIGKNLLATIETHSTFRQEFLTNAAVEEAITSAIYEGASSTRAKAKELIASGKAPKNKDEWMLINNFQAMKWIKENLRSEVNHELILTLHKIVTTNTLEGDDANFSGKYRNDRVFVGPHEGVFFKKIEESIDEAIQITTQNPRYLHGLLKGIVLHYFTAYIHPFFDGNGRTARALFYFKSIKNQLRFVELLSISAHLKEHGKQYEKSFELVKNNDFDVTYFIDFGLDSLLEALKKVETKVNYLLKIAELQGRYDLTDNQIGLLQRLALNKFYRISIEQYAVQIKQSREIARVELKDLAQKNFLTEEKSGKKFIYSVNAKLLREKVVKGD